MNVSTLLSVTSQDNVLVAKAYPQKSSVDAGAVENISTALESIPNPFEGDVESTGC